MNMQVQGRRNGTAAVLIGLVIGLTGCERQYFKAEGSVTSDGGDLAAWSRPVSGCSPDPLDGLPIAQSTTLFTLYWNNPVDRDRFGKRTPPPPTNQLQSIKVSRAPHAFTALLKTSKIEPGTMLDGTVCSTLKATTRPGPPAILGGRPTVDGTLDLDCRVAGSRVTAAVRFTGCEY